MNLIKRRYSQQKSNAQGRGIEWLFTFDEWHEWWCATGKLSERGNLSHQYCMARKGDVGPYSIDNVYCCTNQQNNLQQVASSITRKKMSDAKKGKLPRYLEDEFKYKEFIRQNIDRNTTIVECPFCGKKGGYTAMKRWHFNNCKEGE